jgi:hypothetical protein
MGQQMQRERLVTLGFQAAGMQQRNMPPKYNVMNLPILYPVKMRMFY